MQKVILTQSYEIFIPDADSMTGVKSIAELREYIKSISSKLEPDITHLVFITRMWNVTAKQNRPAAGLDLAITDFGLLTFFVVNGKIPNVSEMSKYIISKGRPVYPERPNMRQEALACHQIGFIPNLCLLENNIVTDMDLKQIRPHATSKEPTALLRFFGPVVINNRLKLR